ncbi:MULTISPECIES: hypothetical protein [Paenibacillus]|uniref:Uncharacterized protein n=1 Tax=Paenibacillus illinoisensis TaxID=59845 RepID=A0A2W0CEW1_9BACL|nr:MULTISPECIES: hypothetical protein [Paenibacillus]PAD29269.1 hypothetical protein CHH60_21420 [Paenibacillus sp. 7523-1]PYY31216.1 Uncharacterized protein PIL02S_00307 [Paenibacillus illinoisensis]
MIKYLYTIEYSENFNEVIFDFGIDTSLKNGYLISNSLGSDIFGDFATVKDEIEKLFELLEGKVTLYEGGGNVNIIKADECFTTIEDIFAEDGEEDSTCKIETLEYAKIILVWAKENYQYKCKRGVMLREEAELAVDWINKKCNKVYELESR